MEGQCHCGQIKYQLKSIPKQVLNCHCNHCRTLSGAAFTSYMVVSESEIDWHNPVAKVYEATPKLKKYFCAQCGTPMAHQHKGYPGYWLVFLGTCQQSATLMPSQNIYADGALSWCEKIL
jgi:hypothetical protein